jgi:L-alanine-DL-glutamate epimerase-like enolase superfamily enzyme
MTPITSFAITRRRWKMRSAVRNAKHAWTERSSAIVELRVGALTGFGEAAPLPGYSRMTEDECGIALAAALPRFVGLDMAAPWEKRLGELDAHGIEGPARFAIETALLDLRARLLDVPLWRLLRDSAIGSPAPVPIGTLITAEEPTAAKTATVAAIERGLRCGKLKVGYREPALEVALGAAIRQVGGADFALRLDANGAWPASSLEARLAEWAPLAPEYVEEPSPVEAWGALERSPVPLALDESLADASESALARLRTLAERGACQVAIVKLGAVGGFAAAGRIAEAAAASGVDVVVTHMFDGPIATAAAAALVLAQPRHVRAAGLDVATYWTDERPPLWCEDGYIVPWREAGLGV